MSGTPHSRQYDLEDRTYEFVERNRLIQESTEIMLIFAAILRKSE